MEIRITTRNEFIQRYWKYYLMLEQNFLDVEQYLAIDELNYIAFSNEYIKQYQTICSEIDVIAKSYCIELDGGFRGATINSYCKCITDNNVDFISRKINVRERNISLFPWKNWTYTTQTQSNGIGKISSNNPDWWTKYNKIKHSRTTIDGETQLPYYKLANQKNVIESLSALFQLELYYFRKLQQTYFSTDADMPGPPSKLFEIENWGNNWVVLDGDLRLQIGNGAI